MTPRLQLAIAQHQQGRLDAADALYRAALADTPRDYDALHMYGVLCLQRGSTEQAIRLLQDAVRVNPAGAPASCNLGLAFQAVHRWDLALACYDHALGVQPVFPEALNNRGTALWNLKRYAEALDCYDRALAQRPDYPEALGNRGHILFELKRHDEAIASYDRALRLQPDSADVLNNRGNALYASGRPEEALASYDRALALQPGFAQAWNNRGTVLRDLRRHDEAIRSFARVVELAPSYPFARGQLLHTAMLACDWDAFDARREALDRDVRAGLPSAEPFGYQAASESPRDLMRCAEIFAAARFPPASAPLWRGEPYDHRRIRIGYVSGEFRQQPTSILLARVFELHDRERFELYAFDNGWDDRSDIRTRIEAAFGEIVDIAHLDDRASAAAIREREIDILVNLNGYFGRARQGVFAMRPSPIQVNYLGFPGTLGASYMDYILGDRFVIPPGDEAFYAEKVVRLPVTYQANDDRRLSPAAPPTRAEAGLPAKAFVFCCFNHPYKITPAIYESWMRLLRDVPGSVLWLLEDNPAAARNLRREAEKHGLVADRIVFAPRVAFDVHLARHRLADLFLDTLPYNAHTTASDALWAGLPVLTCLGTTFPGRVGASLLHAASLPDLVAMNLRDYESRARELAESPQVLAHLRERTAHARSSALFASDAFTRDLESAYAAMRERHRCGEPPDTIDSGPGPI